MCVKGSGVAEAVAQVTAMARIWSLNSGTYGCHGYGYLKKKSILKLKKKKKKENFELYLQKGTQNEDILFNDLSQGWPCGTTLEVKIEQCHHPWISPHAFAVTPPLPPKSTHCPGIYGGHCLDSLDKFATSGYNP